jgi:excisionase family DNA binding protein
MEHNPPEQIAQLLQVNVVTVHRWLRDGKLKSVKLGRLWRVSQENLEEFVHSKTKKEVSE